MSDKRIRSRRDAIERSWSAFMSGAEGLEVREEVLSSWRRTNRILPSSALAAPSVEQSVDPTPLLKSVHILDREFRGTLRDSGLVVALADEIGRIVWTSGEPALLRLAEQANFGPGALWDEASVGINAISLALTSDAPACVWSAEHWSSSLHGWSCYAAPIRHPDTGRRLGVLNFSMAWDKDHPVVSSAVVALAERLAPEIASHSTAHTSASSQPIDLRVLGTHRTTLGGSPVKLSRRQTEILLLLALRPDGLRVEQLHADLYGDAPVGMGTLKAEVSHLRQLLSARISYAPYRVHGPIRVDVLELLDDVRSGRLAAGARKFTGPLLSWSDSPRVIRLARTVEVALRDAALDTHDVDEILQVVSRLDDDAELIEHALRLIPAGDGRRHVMRAQLRATV
jgi:hypothetical protein